VTKRWVGWIEGRARIVRGKGSEACCLNSRGSFQWVSDGRHRRRRGAVLGSEAQLREDPAKGLMELHKRSNDTIHPWPATEVLLNHYRDLDLLPTSFEMESPLSISLHALLLETPIRPSFRT
jgi:hypothetical protein